MKIVTRMLFGVLVVLMLASITGIVKVSGAITDLPQSGGGTWEYCREVTIHENSGDTLSDYPVLVALAGSDFPGEAQADGDDSRFTDADGVNLSYCTCEFDAGSEHAIWVRMPLIPASGGAKPSMIKSENVWRETI